MWSLTINNVPLGLTPKCIGKLLWKPDFGGDFVVFQQYPLKEIVISYCVGDIAFLPELYESLVKVLTAEEIKAVRRESRKLLP